MKKDHGRSRVFQGGLSSPRVDAWPMPLGLVREILGRVHSDLQTGTGPNSVERKI